MMQKPDIDRKSQFVRLCTMENGRASIAETAGACYDNLLQIYSNPIRHYHNLNHIYSMLSWFDFFEKKLDDPQTVFFATWFHDAVYDAAKNDNEEQSALFAETELKKLDFEQSIIDKVKKYILATKTHSENNENDLNYFLDFDLQILGSDQMTYMNYIREIAEEYKIISSEDYKKGRLEFIEKTLAKEQIFKTADFKLRFEEMAKFNLQWEKDMQKAPEP